MAVVPFPARNKLAYPAGARAGFDPSHTAAQNMAPGHGLSAVAIPGGKMVSLLRGLPCTNVAVNVFYALNGGIGPAITAQVVGTSNAIKDSGNAAVVNRGQTLAAIIYYQSNAATQVIVGSGDAFNSAWYLFTTSADSIASYTNSNAIPSITLNNNEAYFVAASNDASNVYFVVKSLQSGKVISATVTGTAASNDTTFTSSGNYVIQADTFNNQAAFPIAAVSYTPACLSPSQLLAWADDPWAFWYPPQIRSRVAAAAATFIAGWARQTNLPVLGTGTY